MRNLLTIAVCFAVFALSNGLKCWSCENANSVDECDRIGEIQQCNPSQNVCGIEIRQDGGMRQAIKVFKFCKQEQACTNVQNQNDKKAWDLSQCNPKFPGSVCRCCCKDDNCNMGDLKCLDKPESVAQCVPELSTPANGYYTCSNGSFVDSVCSFYCDDGYYIEGNKFSVCKSQKDGQQWTAAPPACRPITCPAFPELENGEHICSNKDFLGSTCQLSCNYGYRLVGPETTVCGEAIKGYAHGTWSTSGQFCERKRCVEKMSAPDNGFIKCSDGDFTGSICQFTCSDDYDMLGPYSVECMEGDMYGKPYWNDKAAYCKKKECSSFPVTPLNGYMTCTESKFIHSVCEFKCDMDYYLTGEFDTKCTSASYGLGYSNMANKPYWNNASPVCERKYCAGLPVAPDHGSVSCSDEDFIGSVCAFTCYKSHYLFGYEKSVCMEGKGYYMPYWQHEAPVCKPKRCGAKPAAPKNGAITCSQHNLLGSVCEYSCDKAYYIKGYQTTTCVEEYVYGKLYWDNEAPRCIRKECNTSPMAPANGYLSCSDKNYLGSVCVFKCDIEYDLVGSEQSTCMEDYMYGKLSWDNQYPRCALKQCAYKPKVPAFGYMSCTDSTYYGSICSFKCEEEYNLIGYGSTKCGFPYKKSGYGVLPAWDYETPYCERKHCSDIVVPANGRVVCTDKNFIGTNCEYVCDDHHRRVGDLYSDCKEDYYGYMGWTGKTPVCERITCPKLVNIKKGEINCSDDQNVNSECEFKCTDDDYKLSPRTRHSITCQNDTMWSAEPPCCARSCPPFAVMDFVVVLDSSSSIGAPSWQIMLKFVNNIFNFFVVQTDAMNFGVVRYNKKIDSENQINLNECPDDLEMLKKMVSKLPYDGSGTWTGQAMEYARTNMLSVESGNRKIAPDLVLVITDGRSQDDVVAPAEALRKDGVLTFALGITPTNGKLDLEQLSEIAGAKERLFLAKEGFGTLTPEFAKEISENICGNPCDRPVY